MHEICYQELTNQYQVGHCYIWINVCTIIIAADIDETIANMLQIAKSYITREKIKKLNNIQSHHRYVIMKASKIMIKNNKIDEIMSQVFSSPSKLELVIDFDMEYRTKVVFNEYMNNTFGKHHCIHHISIIGEILSIIDDYFLMNCTSLTTMTVPTSVTCLGTSFLNGCKSLTNVIISNHVTSIGPFFLNDCISLAYIKIPENITHIEESFLYGCKSLTNVIIPNGVTHIGGEFLAEAKSLTSISIPNTITNIGEKFLQYCSSLRSITLPGSIKYIGRLFLSDCSSLEKVIVPANSNIQNTLIRDTRYSHNTWNLVES